MGPIEIKVEPGKWIIIVNGVELRKTGDATFIIFYFTTYNIVLSNLSFVVSNLLCFGFFPYQKWTVQCNQLN